MPDVIALLEQDHRTVEQLFSRFESTKDRQVALQICQELTIHAEVEEQIVYPALAEVDKDLEQEGEREHAEAKELIAKIEGAGNDTDIVPLVLELKKAIEHHVEEEESEAFPKMRQQKAEELDDLGTQVTDLKQQLIAGAASGNLVDLTREELYQMAQEQQIEGRSDMTKEELIEALQQG